LNIAWTLFQREAMMRQFMFGVLNTWFHMVSDVRYYYVLKAFHFDTEDTRNELLSSGIVEAIVKETTVLTKEWIRYVF
jgi:hypothetical protein